MTTTRVAALRVLFVDDHRLLTQSLAVALGAEGVLARAADVTDRSAVLAEAAAAPWDLVLLDLDLGAAGDGGALVAPLRSTGARVLVVSGSTCDDQLGSALEQGAVGVLSKAVPFERLLATVLAAARGEEVTEAAERRRLVDRARAARRLHAERHAAFERLTPREAEVLAALASGTAVGAIARRWHVSQATVRSQVRGVLTKLEVGSQLEAVALVRQLAWSGPGLP